MTNMARYEVEMEHQVTEVLSFSFYAPHDVSEADLENIAKQLHGEGDLLDDFRLHTEPSDNYQTSGIWRGSERIR